MSNTKTKTFIQENNELLNSLPMVTGDTARLAKRLAKATHLLACVIEQANDQFKVGYRRATFSKNFIDNLNER
jgi:hypothetical protein